MSAADYSIKALPSASNDGLPVKSPSSDHHKLLVPIKSLWQGGLSLRDYRLQYSDVTQSHDHTNNYSFHNRLGVCVFVCHDYFS